MGGPAGPLQAIACGLSVSTDCSQMVTETPKCTSTSCYAEPPHPITGQVVYKCRPGPNLPIKQSENVATDNVVQQIGVIPLVTEGNLYWSEGNEVICANKTSCSCPEYDGDEPFKPCSTTGNPEPKKFKDWVPDGGSCTAGMLF